LADTAEAAALPTSPFFLVRQGLIAGNPVAIWAFSPLYRDEQGVQLVTNISAQLQGVTLLDDAALRRLAVAPVANTKVNKALNASSAAPLGLEPTNPDAARQAIKFTVTTAGMQSVSGRQLAEAGFDLATLDPTLLQLKLLGKEVAIELDGLSNGRMTATSSLRFFAPTVGNRWNQTTVYWLTRGATAGLRMGSRSVAPGSAPTRTTALERGQWRDPKLYESRFGGNDLDHWFHAKLISSQNNTIPVESTSVEVTTQLPRVDGTATYTLALTSNIRGQHTLRVQIGNQSADISWNPLADGVFVQDWQYPYTTTVRSTSLAVTLLDAVATTMPSDPITLLDQVAWEQPVQLAFQQNGATFTGLPGTWRYTWRDLPTGYRFYDVTNPAQPTLLTGATATAFQDGPSVHDYLITAPATLNQPTVARHDPVKFNGGGADAIYITYPSFTDALAPLLQLRRDQGYQVTSVDVQTIYDGWSYGQVAPEAIRTFLRYAYANWSPT
ncbi:MAG: hypothetical protein KDE31_21450, partial [Caldilineaceae bacterium]|nr:hypothetical protein [Caldilineaceae bacterium]